MQKKMAFMMFRFDKPRIIIGGKEYFFQMGEVDTGKIFKLFMPLAKEMVCQ